MEKLKQKVKQRSYMCGRFLGIRPQAMQKSGKKIKTFLDGFQDEHGGKDQWSLEPKETGVGGRRSVD